MSEPKRIQVWDDDVMPIEIRPGYFVYVRGIPHDLTAGEANKIANVVLAMAYAEFRAIGKAAEPETP